MAVAAAHQEQASVQAEDEPANTVANNSGQGEQEDLPTAPAPHEGSKEKDKIHFVVEVLDLPGPDVIVDDDDDEFFFPFTGEQTRL